MQTDDLPPLPYESYLGDDVSYGYDGEDMREYARAHAAALQERFDFTLAMCRDAQSMASSYGDTALALQAENDKLRATLRALVDHHDLMSREDYAEIRAARASITGSQG